MQSNNITRLDTNEDINPTIYATLHCGSQSLSQRAAVFGSKH